MRQRNFPTPDPDTATGARPAACAAAGQTAAQTYSINAGVNASVNAGSRAGGIVRGWNRVALQAIGAVRPAPQAAARALAFLHTCMYNAWAAYDDHARQTAHGLAVRLPRAERVGASKAAAMSHAACLALAQAFPAQRASFDARMSGLGLGLDSGLAPHLDAAAPPAALTPAGIGRSQAAAMLGARGAGGSAPAFAAREQHIIEMGRAIQGRQAAAASLPADWCRVAGYVSERERYGDDQDVRLFFALAHALADAGMVSAGDRHACSAAAAEVLRRFTGSARVALREMEQGANRQEVELGRQVGGLVFDKASRCWQGKC